MRLTDADIKLLPAHIQEQIRQKLGQQPKPKKKKLPAQESPLEIEFDQLCRIFGLPAPEKQVKVEEGRRWKFDRAWPAKMLAIEIDGEVNHARYHQITCDALKRNRAKALGWDVRVITGEMLKNNPVEFFEELKKLLRKDK